MLPSSALTLYSAAVGQPVLPRQRLLALAALPTADSSGAGNVLPGARGALAVGAAAAAAGEERCARTAVALHLLLLGLEAVECLPAEAAARADVHWALHSIQSRHVDL